MLRKIILGTLLVGLIGILVVGAVVRTNARVGDEVEVGTGWRSRTSGVAVERGSAGGRGGRWAAQSEAAASNGRGGGWQAGGVPLADVQPEEWQIVDGVVVQVADGLIEIETTAGDVISLVGQPLNFAVRQGLALEVGDAVSLAGFEEDGEFKVGKITDLSDGVSVTLRDVSGRPAWVGRGRWG